MRVIEFYNDEDGVESFIYGTLCEREVITCFLRLEESPQVFCSVCYTNS